MRNETPLVEACRKVMEARSRLETATTTKARRDADEDLNFWQGKVTALSRLAQDAASDGRPNPTNPAWSAAREARIRRQG